MQAEEKKDIEKIVQLQSAIKFNGGGVECSLISCKYMKKRIRRVPFMHAW